MMNIATVFNAQGDHQRAEQMINPLWTWKTEVIPWAQQDHTFLPAQIMLDTMIKVRQYSLKHAERLLDGAITISRRIWDFWKFFKTVMSFWPGLKKTGNYQQSLFYTKGYHSMRDSVFSASWRDQIFNLEKNLNSKTNGTIWKRSRS